MTARLLGHDTQETAFLDAMAGRRGAHAWLLAGQRGIGKAGFARRAATWLVATGQARSTTLDVAQDHPARQVIDAGAHPEFLWITREVAASKAKKGVNEIGELDLARNVTVEQVRALNARLRNRPAVAERRAVVIDSIDDFERGAANALLKTLEEPPDQTVFLLVTHSPGGLLPTIRSRCRMLRFAPLDAATCAQAVAAARPDLDPEAVEALVTAGDGSPGRALGFAEAQGAAAIEQRLRKIAARGDADNRERSALARQFAQASGRSSFDMMVAQAIAIAGEHARAGRVAIAIGARERILRAGAQAVRNSEDLGSAAFAIGTGLASLAR